MNRVIVPLLVAVVSFVACAPAVAPTGPLPSAAPADPFVNIGDQLTVTVWRDPEFSGEFEVDADGRLAHPLYQSLTVARLPLSAVTQRLQQFLGVHQQDPEILVKLSVPVSVGGAVGSPNRYLVPYGTTIMDVVAEAGGAGDQGRLDRVRLVRGTTERTLDLTDPAVLYGRIPVMSGDQIFVGRRSGFNWYRDLFAPITSLATLTISIINLIER
jgi:polysaccharide export outer membrane protein